MPSHFALIATAALLAATHTGAFFFGHRVADNARLEQALQYEEERTTLAEALAAAQSAVRAEEQRRAAAVEEIRRDAQKQIARIRVDADSAYAVGVRLRDRVKALTATCGGPSGDTAAAAGGKAIANGLVLSDVFSEMERTGRAMAEEADRRGAAGDACERAYDALNAR